MEEDFINYLPTMNCINLYVLNKLLIIRIRDIWNNQEAVCVVIGTILYFKFVCVIVTTSAQDDRDQRLIINQTLISFATQNWVAVFCYMRQKAMLTKCAMKNILPLQISVIKR